MEKMISTPHVSAVKASLSPTNPAMRWSKLASLTVIMGVASNAGANGLALNEQSASSAGTAYAGRSSSALDASTLYGNPAGLGKLTRMEVSGGIALIDAKTDISDASGAAPGTNKGDSVPLTAVPFGYISVPIDDRFTFGVGVYAPDGLVNDYEDSFQGRYYGSYSKVQVITVQPTVAYRINEHVMIGFGPTINRIDGKLKNDLATGVLNNGVDTTLTIKGDDTAIGYNIGLLVDINDSLTWGITYHSKVDYHLSGSTTVSNAPGLLGLNGKYSAKLDITLPESVDTSVTYKFDDRWTGYLGTTWTRWSRVEAIRVVNSGLSPIGQQLGFGTIEEDLSWHDTWSVAAGLAYQLSPQWVLRTGFAYDPSPTNNSDRNVRIPVGDRRSIALGVGYSPSSDMTIDLAYGYLWEDRASVNRANTTGLQPSYSAKYENSGKGVVAQLSYRF